MHGQRPYVLTIAGFDPCSGAGLTADIKTFEQNRVYGLAICTGLTLQTENQFFSIQWRDLRDIKNELKVLLEKYPVAAVKFGIVPSLEWLVTLTDLIRDKNKDIQIVVDPVWKSSTGFTFAHFEQRDTLEKVLRNITLLTPNLHELTQMAGSTLREKYLEFLSEHTHVLLKGGHDETQKGTDIFYGKKETRTIKPNAFHVFDKHGSGCVLSSSITAHLAMQYDVFDACVNGKRYTEAFLASNPHLLGYHAA